MERNKSSSASNILFMISGLQPVPAVIGREAGTPGQVTCPSQGDERDTNNHPHPHGEKPLQEVHVNMILHQFTRLPHLLLPTHDPLQGSRAFFFPPSIPLLQMCRKTTRTTQFPQTQMFVQSSTLVLNPTPTYSD